MYTYKLIYINRNKYTDGKFFTRTTIMFLHHLDADDDEQTLQFYLFTWFCDNFLSNHLGMLLQTY